MFLRNRAWWGERVVRRGLRPSTASDVQELSARPVAASCQGWSGPRLTMPWSTRGGDYFPFFSFLAARFSFRFFWADFLEALPPPLSLLAMRAIYRLKEERAEVRSSGALTAGWPERRLGRTVRPPAIRRGAAQMKACSSVPQLNVIRPP
jgi:hypothetical protein